MHTIKRLFCLTLALTLSLSMAVIGTAEQLALPDESRDGTSSITIHKYEVDSLDAFAKRATGEELDEDYELYTDGENNPVTLGDLADNTLAGIPFKVTRVQDTDTEPDTATAYTGPGATYMKNNVTGADGTIKFDSLPFGVYLVEELDHSEVTTPMEPFLIHVPLTNPQGNGWLYDLHVYPKNVLEDGPDIDKNILDEDTLIDSKSVNVGDTVTWQIDVDIPSGIALSKLYTITDSLDTRLTYAGNLVVYYTDKAGVKTPLTKDTDYTPTEPAATSGGTLIVDFDETAMRQKLAGALAGSGDQAPTLTVQFDTTVHSSARTLDNMGEEIPNSATVDFTNSNDKDYKEESPEPEVHTGGIRIYKVDARLGTELDGAVFQIYKSEEDAKKDNDPLPDPTDSAKAWQVTTQDGIAHFLGLAYGDYWLVEVKAPSGYNLLSAPEKATVDATSHLEARQIRVENKSGFTLPVTGGTGTVFFTLGGTTLIAGAAVLLFFTRRRKKAQ